MYRKILFIIALTMLLISSCSSPEITYTPPPIQGDWTVRMTQSGGFAGVMRNIKVSSNGECTFTDERSKQTVTHQLSKEQLTELGSLIENLELTSAPSSSVCADCFIYEIEIKSAGKKMLIHLDDMSLPNSGAQELIAFLSGLMQ